jgi:hypothetical protein
LHKSLLNALRNLPYSITEEEGVELILEKAGGNMDKGAVPAFFRKHLKIDNH